MTWPTTDAARQGLLPDYFLLKRQISDGPAINPGTVGAHLPEAYGRGKIYDFHRFNNGWIVHAPCAITGVAETGGVIRFGLQGWGNHPYQILAAGVDAPPREVRASGQPIESFHHSKQKLLILSLKGKADIQIKLP